MFNQLLHDVTFEDIVVFCQKWPEGVRVDYKREPANIPKIVSSLANTMGGLWIIGADADKKTNAPILPLKGLLLTPGIEEQITQSCLQGVYPPILPHVRVIPLPGSPERAVVIVKVAESIEAPHAIENWDKVYIRTSSISEVIKLAEIDRIEYLLNRRKAPEKNREDLIRAAFERARVKLPHLRVTIGPTYPYRPFLTADNLSEAETLISRKTSLNALPRLVRYFQSGMISYQRDTAQMEINVFGQLSLVQHLELIEPKSPTEKNIRAISFLHIVLCIGRALRAAEILLRETTINLYVRVELEAIEGLAITPPEDADSKRLYIEEHTSIQTRSMAEIYVVRETLGQDFTDHVIQLVQQLMWTFDLVGDSVPARVAVILKANNLGQ